jgi:hypothetical protein
MRKKVMVTQFGLVRRVQCSPHNDAHCAMCTNKPEGNTRYIEPGNNNDCAWEQCEGLCPALTDTNEAVVVVDVLVPVDDAEFPAVEEGVRNGIADVAQVPSSSIFFAERVVRTHTETRHVNRSGDNEGVREAQRRLLADNEPLNEETLDLTSIEEWSCSMPIPEHNKYLQLAVEITVTEDKVEALFDRLTGFAIAEAMADRCLPPVLLVYENATPPTASLSSTSVFRAGFVSSGLLAGQVLLAVVLLLAWKVW